VARDPLAEAVKVAAELRRDADVDLRCRASYGERRDNRVNLPQRASEPALEYQGRIDRP
jgi:hypothetical protein